MSETNQESVKKFRLPRKVKKIKLSGIWLYPKDEKRNSQMAFPRKYQKDYTAIKQGVVKNFLQGRDRESSKEMFKKLNVENYVSDDVLKTYVDDYFAKEYRKISYEILLEAKYIPEARESYFNFVNAYQMHLQDGSYRNTPAMAVDHAEYVLKQRRKRRKEKKRNKRRKS